MESGICRSEHVGLGDSIFSELYGDGHHPTPGSGNSDVGNQLECLFLFHPRLRDRFVVRSKLSQSPNSSHSRRLFTLFETCVIKWDAHNSTVLISSLYDCLCSAIT